MSTTNPNSAMPDSLLPIPPEMSTITDSLLAVLAASIQLGATVLFVVNCELVRSFGWILQGAIVAAAMSGYFSAVHFILNWRSKRQIGEPIDSWTVNYSAFVGPTVLSFTVAVCLGRESVETLWVNCLLTVVACYLVDLSRAKVSGEVFPGVVHGMLMPSMFWMKGHLYWGIGCGLVTVVLVYLVFGRQEQWEAVKKAEDLRKEEAEQGTKTEKEAEEEGEKTVQEATKKVEED